MSQDTKEKYLQQARLLLNKTEKVQKPLANVEPYVRSIKPVTKDSSKKSLRSFQQDQLPSSSSHQIITDKQINDSLPQTSGYYHTYLTSPSIPVSPTTARLQAESPTHRYAWIKNNHLDVPEGSRPVYYKPLHEQSHGELSSVEHINSNPGQVYPTCSTPIANHPKQSATSLFSTDESKGTLEGCQKCSDLEQRVKFLTEVNRELKRLLVASLGNNLKLQLEQLIHEKAAMSCDLDMSLHQLADNMEVVDRVSIDCDIWRSKYLASRLMIDELGNAKREVSLHFTESQQALECILAERNELCEILKKCNIGLRKIVNTLIPNQPVSNTVNTGTVFSAAQSTVELVQLLHDRYNWNSISGDRSTGSTVLNHAEMALEPTKGEKLAKQVLSSQDRHVLLPLKLKDSDISRHSAQRLKGASRKLLLLDSDSNVSFHCSGCKGPLFHV